MKEKDLKKTSDESLEGVSGGYSVEYDYNTKNKTVTKVFKVTKLDKAVFEMVPEGREKVKDLVESEGGDFDKLLKKGKIKLKTVYDDKSVMPKF